MSARHCSSGHGRERGGALVCALVLMLAVMLVGVSASRAVFASIASSSAGRERSIAYAAAEAALLDAQRDIAGAGADPARAAHFTAAGAGGFVEGCGHGGSGLGLCLATSPPAWQLQDLADPGNAALVPYGHYTGARLATGAGLLPARAPAYLIENIVPPGATASLGRFYRITAIGFGSHAAVQVVLQAVVRVPPAPATPATPAAPPMPAGILPAGRMSWREIANWPRLHAQAAE